MPVVALMIVSRKAKSAAADPHFSQGLEFRRDGPVALFDGAMPCAGRTDTSYAQE